MAVRWRRLWQPQRGLFWLLLAFNLLGSACAWALHLLPLNGPGFALLAVLGLANSGAGLVVAWLLLQQPAPGEQAPR
jgi:hypothetical protein